MKTKLYLMVFACMFCLTACHPSVDARLWENEIKLEMQAHKAWLVALDAFDDRNIKASYFDQNPRKHRLDALQFIISYVQDSLESYRAVENLYRILAEKDAVGDLHIENKDGAQDQMSGALANALFGSAFGSVYENYTKKYALIIAKCLNERFDKIKITLDTPEFVKKTKDRIIYSVYCPTYNEIYTLSIDRTTNEYYWSLETGDN